MATKKRYLTGEQRLILEENGVIDAPQVPRSDQLEESIRARGWGLDVSVSAKGFAVAKVKSGHGSFDGAIVEALCATLKARPRKMLLFDPAIDQAPGVQDERGPVAGGAPDADWAERLTDPDAYDAFIDRASADLLGGPNDDTHVPETGLPRIGFWTERERRVRENFPAEFAGGDKVCRACGVTIEAHDPEVCAGGTPETRKRRSRKMAEDFSTIAGEAKGAIPEESDTNGEDRVPGHLSASPNGANGAHDRDDAAGILLDPDRVMATLAQLGKPIAYQELPDGSRGYLNPVTGERYSAQWVEGEYRAALAGRAR